MAYLTKIEFDNPINSSLQIGDAVYVANMLTGGTVGPPKFAGPVLDVGSHFVIIGKDNAVAPRIILAPNPQYNFILFAKNIQANESSLKGYYADVTLENSSNTKTELFAISSEVVPSSK